MPGRMLPLRTASRPRTSPRRVALKSCWKRLSRTWRNPNRSAERRMAERVRCPCCSPERMKPRKATSSQMAGTTASRSSAIAQGRGVLLQHRLERRLDGLRQREEPLDDRPELVDQRVERQRRVPPPGPGSAAAASSSRRVRRGAEVSSKAIATGMIRMNACPATMLFHEEASPCPDRYSVRNQAELSISAKQSNACAAGRHGLAVADQVPEPAPQVEPLGLAEEDVLALELLDRPPQGHGAVDDRRDQHRQEVAPGHGVVAQDQGPQQERDAGDRHQAVEEVQLDRRGPASGRSAAGRSGRGGSCSTGLPSCSGPARPGPGRRR